MFDIDLLTGKTDVRPITDSLLILAASEQGRSDCSITPPAGNIAIFIYSFVAAFKTQEKSSRTLTPP